LGNKGTVQQFCHRNLMQPISPSAQKTGGGAISIIYKRIHEHIRIRYALPAINHTDLFDPVLLHIPTCFLLFLAVVWSQNFQFRVIKQRRSLIPFFSFQFGVVTGLRDTQLQPGILEFFLCISTLNFLFADRATLCLRWKISGFASPPAGCYHEITPI